MDTTCSQYQCGLPTYLPRFFVLSCLLIGVLSKELADTHRTVEVSSLLPSASCSKTSATQGGARTSSLTVAHKHGPCAPLDQSNPSRLRPTQAAILEEDQLRVDLINSWMTSKMAEPVMGPSQGRQLAADVPARSSGRTMVGSGNYVVTVGLGTPKQALSLVIDTTSLLTWTQCKPCSGHCYQQKEPVFYPTASTSYANISCASTACSQLTSAAGSRPGCSSSTCVYDIKYGESSQSVGFLGKEKLALTPKDTFNNFMFGCSQNDSGLFGGAAGILGLGWGKLSLVEQTATKYGRYFSYCLPSSPSSTGHLTFGKRASPASTVKFTPLSTISRGASFYGITIEGISVEGNKLSIPESVFSGATAIIDSGTVITRLPPTAYAALRDAFRQQMTGYPASPPFCILDTCYDLSMYYSFIIPKVEFSFSGSTYVDLFPIGILFVATPTQFCLAFAANSDDADVLIYGNLQQQMFEVVYDVGAMKLGFGPNGCD